MACLPDHNNSANYFNNINCIWNSDRCAVLLQWLRSLSVVPDVVCLQEAHCVSDVECQSWFRSPSFFICYVSWFSKNLVALSFSLVALCRLSISRLMMLVILCLVSFVSRINRFVSFPCTRQISTLQGTGSLRRSPLRSTHQSLLSCMVTSIRSLSACSIVQGRMPLMPLRFRTYLMRVVLSTPGVTIILHPQVSPG